jgi:hypothetical protein
VRDSRSATLAGLFVLAMLGTACGRGGERADSGDSAAGAGQAPRSAVAPATASPAPGTPRPACARTGHWIPCQVRERLERSGLVLRDTTIEGLPATGVTPTVWRLGRGAVAVYLFPDSLARARAAARLDTVKYVPPSQPLTMYSEGTRIENDNLLALLFSKNDQQRERVSDALTAGPPQP